MKRPAGRPKRGSDVAARAKLLLATQHVFRNHTPDLSLPRGQIAKAAGLSPAIVTYYFRDEFGLIQAAASPLIERYIDDLRQLSSSVDLSGLEQLSQLVSLLIRVAREDGRLIDQYVVYCKQQRDPSASLFLKLSFEIISLILNKCVDCGAIRPHNVPFFQTMLWGACRSVAQSNELSDLMFPGDVSTANKERLQTEMIIGILLQGLKA